MISIETQNLILKLFNSIAESERSIEIHRQMLSDLYDFDAYQIFKFLDYNEKNRIDSNDLINYLNSESFMTNQEETNLVILFYDKDFDGVLAYPEFISLVQSEKSLHKFPFSSKNNSLSYNVKKCLKKLLEKEIELARNVLYILKDIKKRYDFNIHELYHFMKGVNCFIIPDNIRLFFQKNNIKFIEPDIKSIIKRIDLNKDGRIDLAEFHIFFGYPECFHCCPCLNCVKCGTCFCNECFSNIPCHYHKTIIWACRMTCTQTP